MPLLKNSKPTEPFRLSPELLTDPAIEALNAKRTELSARRVDLEDERHAIWELPRTAPTNFDNDVAVLLDEAKPDTLSRTGAAARLAEITRELQAVDRALAVLEQRLGAARNALSVKVREAVRPEYAARVKALAAALAAAWTAAQSYREVTDELDRQDVLWSPLTRLWPVQVFGDEAGLLAGWFREARQAGYLTADGVPAELR